MRVVRHDGREDVILVRLTPPTEGFEASLPLAQPLLAPVRTLDGRYEMRGHIAITW